jgi:hypothetical protein
MNSTMQFLTWGMMPVGAMLGGAIGEWFGVTTTVTVAALGIQIAVVGTLLSPVRNLRHQSTAPAAHA